VFAPVQDAPVRYFYVSREILALLSILLKKRQSQYSVLLAFLFRLSPLVEGGTGANGESQLKSRLEYIFLPGLIDMA